MPLEWDAETLRLSLFFSEPLKVSVGDWQKITGTDEPESTQNAPGRRSMLGPFQRAALQISTIGPRVDCMLVPKSPSEQLDKGYVPSVGPIPDALNDFVTATAAWLASLEQPVHRIAFAGAVFTKCGTIREGYATLLSMLRSVKGDPDKMRELIFRINWPVQSRSLNDLTLNRITAWSILRLNIQVVAQIGQTTTVEDTPMSNVIRMEFDHNTDAERTTLMLSEPPHLTEVH
jgi:hypothetical protein